MSDVGQYMSKQLALLSNLKDESIGKARIARLRRGAGKTPGEIPELWGEFLNDLPDEMLSKNGIPSFAEWAIYLSLTMYALHQQGNAECVHCSGERFGKAVARLMNDNTDEERERVLRRFGPIATAKDMPELSYHLRCVVQLLSSKKIKLDYVQLAEDIYNFQFHDRRKNVQLKWGEEFYYNKKGEN